MKKFVPLLLLVVSCKDYKVKQDEVSVPNAGVVTIGVRNEYHEYLLYSFHGEIGFSHLPNCTYCNEKQNTDSIHSIEPCIVR